MKILITENQLRKVQFKYLDYLFEGMYEVKLKKYPNSIFWKKDDEVVLELKKSGKMWVYYKIWDDFSYMFPLEYNETEQVMKEWLEKHLNLEGIKPRWRSEWAVVGLEEITASIPIVFKMHSFEEHLNLEKIDPRQHYNITQI